VAHLGGLVERFVDRAVVQVRPVFFSQTSSGDVHWLRPQMAAMSEPPMPDLRRTACHSSRDAAGPRTTAAPDGKDSPVMGLLRLM
jgi:hypothetical protein